MAGSSAIALFVEKQPCIIYTHMRSLLILISLMLAPSSAFVVAPAARVAPVATPAAVRCQAAPKMFIG